MPLINRTRKITPARIEWSAWSAPVLFAEEYDGEFHTTWGVFVPAHRAIELGLDPNPERKDSYLLASNLSGQDAEAFIRVFGPMLEAHFYPEGRPPYPGSKTKPKCDGKMCAEGCPEHG